MLQPWRLLCNQLLYQGSTSHEYYDRSISANEFCPQQHGVSLACGEHVVYAPPLRLTVSLPMATEALSGSWGVIAQLIAAGLKQLSHIQPGTKCI